MKLCEICDEKITKEDETILTRKQKDVHFECYQDEMNEASTLYHFTPDGGVEKTIFTDNFVGAEDGGLLEDYPEPIKKQKWVQTDGWRGYTDWDYKDGFKELADGWITGIPDETTERKRELGEMFEDLMEGRVSPPTDIYWLFGLTGNVFSQASAIIIRSGDEQLIDDWLNEINGGTEGLKNKFN